MAYGALNPDIDYQVQRRRPIVVFCDTSSTSGYGSHDINIDDETNTMQSLSKAGDYTDIKWIIHKAGRDAMDKLWQQARAKIEKEKKKTSAMPGE